MARTAGSRTNRTLAESEVLQKYLKIQTSMSKTPLVSENVVSKMTGINKRSLRNLRDKKTISIKNEQKIKLFFNGLKLLLK